MVKQKKKLVCYGEPNRLMRSEKQNENFILHIEWMHIEPGGNSVCLVLVRLPIQRKNHVFNGVEVQMLELDWDQSSIRTALLRRCICSCELFGVRWCNNHP